MKKCSFILILSILTASFSCKDEDSKKIRLYTDHEKQIIENFSKSLEDSINTGSYHALTASWDLEAFEFYFKNESRISKKILRYFFRNKTQKAVGNYLLEIVDRIIKNNGYAKLVKIAHHGNHSVISFVYSYGRSVDFALFKLKIRNKEVVISDVYSFRTNDWYSESLKKALNLNIQYTIQTEERKQVNNAISGYKIALQSEDYRSAFTYLDSIPLSHQNDLTKILKIEAASQLNIKNFGELLKNECNLTDNVCLLYAYATFYENQEYRDEVVNSLEILTGSCHELDSLKNESLIWNHLYPDPFALLSVYEVQFIL